MGGGGACVFAGGAPPTCRLFAEDPARVTPGAGVILVPYGLFRSYLKHILSQRATTTTRTSVPLINERCEDLEDGHDGHDVFDDRQQRPPYPACPAA